MGLTPVGGSENSFSDYFDLRTLLRYLKFFPSINYLNFLASGETITLLDALYVCFSPLPLWPPLHGETFITSVRLRCSIDTLQILNLVLYVFGSR